MMPHNNSKNKMLILQPNLEKYILLRLALNCRLKQSMKQFFKQLSPRITPFLHQRQNLPILLNASVSLFVSSSDPPAADKFEAPKLLNSSAKNKFNT